MDHQNGAEPQKKPTHKPRKTAGKRHRFLARASQTTLDPYDLQRPFQLVLDHAGDLGYSEYADDDDKKTDATL